ncbi:unnamed protein product [Moneuplotes crassus]|uniref:Uncharacterized protein n=2 Tax=Euplotes crassus TaxID=5936 RepID=A0AAD1XHR5_EUPCR|nr:unnamed protein product [Moneuplotes crassus]
MYKSASDMPKTFKSHILLEILVYGRKMDLCYKEYFSAYLENPASNACMYSDKNTLVLGYDNNWCRFYQNISGRNDISSVQHDFHRNLLFYYLDSFYRADVDISQWEKFFNKNDYKEMLSEIKFLNGEEVNHQDIPNLEELGTKVMINILDSNLQHHKVDDKVQILCDLKNTPTVYIKIYEFNAENYYKSNLSEFNSQIDLDGLEPAFQRIEEFKETPQKKYRHRFDIPEIKKKPGIYVIDFISNGISSRAVIKKGNLTLIRKDIREGHECYILDENREICKEASTAIWFSDNFYKADDDGKILIPYCKDSNEYSKAVLLSKGISDIEDFCRSTENYDFKCIFTLNHESLLMGKNASLIITPQLRCNYKKINLDCLNKIEVRVTMKSYVDDLPMTKVFDDLQLSQEKDIVVNFQVPPNLGSIEINVDAEVRNLAKGVCEKKTYSCTRSINAGQYSHQVFKSHLRKYKGEYYFYLLGKAGEPVPNAEIELIQIKTMVTDNKIYYDEFVTDKDGCIKLGNLKEVVNIRITGNKNNVSFQRDWNLPYLDEKFYYPDTLDYLEGEDILLPYPHDMFNSGCIVVAKVDRQNGSAIKNCFDSIEYQRKEGHDFGDILIKGLEPGKYVVGFKKLEKEIQLSVHKGVYWETDDYILTKNKLLKIPDNNPTKRITHLEIEEEGKEECSKVSFKIDGSQKNLKVHCFAFNTFPADIWQTINDYTGLPREYLETTQVKTSENEYLSNKRLNEELRYALERKYLKSFIGTTLERPSLLFKSKFFKDTYFDTPQQQTGFGYQKKAVYKKSVAIFDNYKLASKSRKYGGGNVTSGNVYPDTHLNSYTDTEYDGYLNFLDTPPFIVPNVKNRDGEYSFNINTSLYTNMIILAVGEDGATHKCVDIPRKDKEIPPLKKRKVELDKPLDSEKHYQETRNACSLKPGEEHIIDDITSVDYQTIDSVQKVGKVLQELLRLKHEENQPFTTTSWLYNWNNLDDELKNKKYSMNMCNELNFFLYFKDKEYFEEVVKPSIAAKIEKSLIDYFLLEDYENVTRHKYVSAYDNLNALEQCLLIAVINRTDKDTAKHLASSFVNKAKLIETKIAKKNQKFDTVLLMKIIESDEVEDDDNEGGPKLDKKKGKKKKIKRQRSMSCSSDSSIEEMNWQAKRRYDSDSDYDCEGEDYEYEGEGGGGGECEVDEDDSEYSRASSYNMPIQVQRGRAGLRRRLSNSSLGSMLSDEPNDIFEEQIQECEVNSIENDFDFRNNVMQSNDVLNIPRQNRNVLAKAPTRIYEKNQKSLFKETEPCKQYCETHYFKEISNTNFKKLSKRSEFYTSLIDHILSNNPSNMRDLQFLTPNFIYSSITLTDLMALLALIDLPWQSTEHKIDPKGERGICIKAETNLLIYKKELQTTEYDQDENLMVIHRFFDVDNRTSEIKIEEFMTQRVYGCEIIISNVSSSTQEIQYLHQIPANSVPLKNHNYQSSSSISIAPYSTHTCEFLFYFPSVGTFSQFPTNISSQSKVISTSKKYSFTVVDKKDSSNFERFSDLALSGDKEAILKFLKEGNLFQRELMFHMKYLRNFLSDKAFYEKAISICRERRVYGFDLWKYGFKHFDLQAVRELIETDQDAQKATGVYFESSLIKCSPEKSNYRYYDFFPMINPRAHKLENEKSAVMFNRQFCEQYQKFLVNLVEKDHLNSEDNLVFSTYLLLQDRIEEAHKVFQKVDSNEFKNPEKQSLVIQYDYLSAYFDILLGYDTGFKIARKLSKHYSDYPVITWRMRFTEILDQLDEFDGKEVLADQVNLEDTMGKEETKLGDAGALEKKEQNITLDFKIEDKEIQVDYENIESVNVKYYIVNPEILFTREPFEMKNFGVFSYVKPVFQQIKILPPKSKIFAFKIDKKYETQNILIELDCGKKKCLKTYFPCSLKVIPCSFDEIKVVDLNGKPIPKVYVKSFMKDWSSQTKFYKDGYTDMRGKFEYGSTNAEKLSILVFSEKYGCVMKEIKLKSQIKIDADIGYLNQRQAHKYLAHSKAAPKFKGKKRKF